MKTIKEVISKMLFRVSNERAKKLVNTGDFKYSTKGAYKSMISTVKKFTNRSKKTDNPFGSKSIFRS